MKKNFFDPEVEVVELNSKPMKRLEDEEGTGDKGDMSGNVVHFDGPEGRPKNQP